MKVLPDTSIWVDYLRAGGKGRTSGLDRLLADDQVVVTGPVVAELLAGTSSDGAGQLWAALSGLPWADLDHEGWASVGEVGGRLRAGGRTLPLIDVVIAVAAVRFGAQLWTRDRDFDVIGRALPKLRRYRPSQG